MKPPQVNIQRYHRQLVEIYAAQKLQDSKSEARFQGKILHVL
jgi:hypothetical protein